MARRRSALQKATDSILRALDKLPAEHRPQALETVRIIIDREGGKKSAPAEKKEKKGKAAANTGEQATLTEIEHRGAPLDA